MPGLLLLGVVPAVGRSKGVSGKELLRCQVATQRVKVILKLTTFAIESSLNIALRRTALCGISDYC